MACVNSCESCEIIAVGAVVTVRERQGTGSGGVGVVRAVNHDGTLCVKYTLGGTARAVASADCRPGNHAGEHYENKLTKWRKRVDGFFGCDEKEEDGAFAARVAVLRLDDLIDKKSPEQVEYVLDKMLHVPRPPVQVAFLQGAIPLQAGACFDKLIDLLQGPTGGGDGGGLAIATTCQGRGCAKKKEAAAWRTTGSSWLGRRIILEPACIGAKFLHPCGALSKCNPPSKKVPKKII
mmetsp:Transcript_8352/g.23607  ORF Transcript_8352/g.23607 Transcript_8352/m.23607 type:complete len:236 (+) Transcript_8352:240-947(+)